MINKVNEFLSHRLKKTEKTAKMKALATQTVKGNLTSFSGIFGIAELNQKEKEDLYNILSQHAGEGQPIDEDLQSLIAITSEVKAISNQAVILHGERIKKVHDILTQYKDGAFTEWLINTYGNRQTPYNFLQYYQFYTSTPQPLRPQLEAMPKQAIYTLASREGDIEQKQQIIQSYKGETKQELLNKIRDVFPLKEKDKRQPNYEYSLIKQINNIRKNYQKTERYFTETQKQLIRNQLQDFLIEIGN